VVWVKHCGFPVGEISVQRDSLDRGRLIAVDLVQGAIFESGNHRGRETIVGCFLESQKLEASGCQVVSSCRFGGVNLC
jgi:hypothetical protein